MFQFCPAQKWYRCSPQRANCAKPRRAPVADSVSRLLVQGREHSLTGSGRTMVRSRGGPISYPTGQPSGSWKYVETGTSLYVRLRRLTKLVGNITDCVYIVNVDAIQCPLFVFKNYGSTGEDRNTLFCLWSIF